MVFHGSAVRLFSNGMTNATYNDASGKPHFYSQYLYADLILNNQIKTGSERWPINLILEYENNLNAEDHPLAANGAVLTNLGKQGHVYMGDISVGQNKSKMTCKSDTCGCGKNRTR